MPFAGPETDPGTTSDDVETRLPGEGDDEPDSLDGDRAAGSPGGSEVTAGEEVGTNAEFFATSDGDLQITSGSSPNSTGTGAAADDCSGPDCDDAESRARVQNGANASVEGGTDSEFRDRFEQARARATGREETSDQQSATNAANAAESNLPLGFVGFLVGLFGLLWAIFGGGN